MHRLPAVSCGQANVVAPVRCSAVKSDKVPKFSRFVCTFSALMCSDIEIGVWINWIVKTPLPMLAMMDSEHHERDGYRKH